MPFPTFEMPSNPVPKTITIESELHACGNTHIAATTDHILQQDPDALLIIMGDHGSHRHYGDQWKVDDPNANFSPGNVDRDVMALDFFGILLAVHSQHRCDDLIYDTLTP